MPRVDSKRRKTENKSFGCEWSVHAIHAKDQEWVIIDKVNNVHNEHQRQPQQQQVVTILQSAEQIKNLVKDLPEEQKDVFKEYVKNCWESYNSVFQAVLNVPGEEKITKKRTESSQLGRGQSRIERKGSRGGKG
jgi:hypothetical protein